MKTSLYYFSGTGNTLDIARHLASQLEDADIFPISNYKKPDVSITGEAIGIIFPVYFMGLPVIVRDFIEKIHHGDYIFLIANHGGSHGKAIDMAYGILKKKGLKVSAAFDIKMPDNYIPIYDIVPVGEQEKMFQAKSAKISEIADIVKEQTQVAYKGISLLTSLFYSLVYHIASPRFRINDKKFWTDERCNGCSTCKNVCPVNNIIMVQGKPQYQHNCEQCFACIHWCPQESLQIGKKTINRKRYRNPVVKLGDFFINKE